MVESRSRTRRRGRLGAVLVGILAIAAVWSIAAAGTATTAPLPACITPTFANGLTQNVFPAPSPSSNPANYINENGWVEAPFDSDFDGKNDRIHFDVTRQVETNDPTCNLKVPTIFEDSPYYANLGPSRSWVVDHEIGSPPA